MRLNRFVKLIFLDPEAIRARLSLMGQFDQSKPVLKIDLDDPYRKVDAITFLRQEIPFNANEVATPTHIDDRRYGF
jgi:hypothetical protein